MTKEQTKKARDKFLSLMVKAKNLEHKKLFLECAVFLNNEANPTKAKS
jgi:hypothetical protein